MTTSTWRSPNDDYVLDINLVSAESRIKNQNYTRWSPKVTFWYYVTADGPRMTRLVDFLVFNSICWKREVLSKKLYAAKMLCLIYHSLFPQNVAHYISQQKVEPCISMKSPISWKVVPFFLNKILVPPPPRQLFSLDKSSKTTTYEHNFDDILSQKKVNFTLLCRSPVKGG